MAFPFRSHTSNISSCHINVNGEIVFNCAKARENESDSIGETLQCFYSVTGEPPDLNLTIHFRNMVRKYNGLWSVNISNNLGSGVVLIQVNIKVDNDLPDVQINTTVGKRSINTLFIFQFHFAVLMIDDIFCLRH